MFTLMQKNTCYERCYTHVFCFFVDLTSSFYGTPIDFGFVTSLTESAEFSGRIKFFAGMEDTPILINFATKFSKKINSFCGALGIKYGFCTDPIFAPYGYSYGSGLGFTGALGIQGLGYYFFTYYCLYRTDKPYLISGFF